MRPQTIKNLLDLSFHYFQNENYVISRNILLSALHYAYYTGDLEGLEMVKDRAATHKMQIRYFLDTRRIKAISDISFALTTPFYHVEYDAAKMLQELSQVRKSS